MGIITTILNAIKYSISINIGFNNCKFIDVNLEAIPSNIGTPPKSLYNIKSKLNIKSIGITINDIIT